MKNSLLKLFLILLSSLSLNMQRYKDNVKERFDIFYQRIMSEGISYVIDDQISLIYNYDSIKNIADEIFKDNCVSIKEYNGVLFELEVKVEKYFFTAFICEKYELKKGDMYEKFN